MPDLKPQAIRVSPQGKPVPRIPDRDLGYEGNPVHLVSTAVLDPGTGAPTTAIALREPKGRPMEIHTIKVRILDTGSNGAQYTFGDAVSMRLDLGQIPLCGNFVPVWVLGPARPGALPPTTGLAGGTAQLQLYREYICKLDMPMYVPPGGVLVPSLQHNGLPNDQLTVQVGIAGRSLRRPKAGPRHYPFFSSYSSPQISATATTASMASTESDLANASGDRLDVRRFVGRLQAYTNNGGSFQATGDQSKLAEVQSQSTLVQMFDSSGFAMVGNPTPFYNVFSYIGRCWETRFFMEPNDFVLFSADYTPSRFGTLFAASTGFFQASVGMVGYHEVSP